MSSLADRLRGVVGVGRRIRPGGDTEGLDDSWALDAAAPLARAHDADSAADVLGGEWQETAGQRFLIVDRQYPSGHRHGHAVLADALPSDAEWPHVSLLAGVPCAGPMLFVDLETTGLAGGAGTYAFLVGCGWFSGGTFHIRQFFLSSYIAERALLGALAELAADTGAVVTYNGKSFDLPLIETRFQFHRMTTPFEGLPHLDMLHPARRLWKASRAGLPTRTGRDSREPLEAGVSACTLTALEQTVLGHVREGDVPGFEIPSRYFHYVRTGDARPLEGVLEHNRLDIVSLALVAARATTLLDRGPDAVATAREAVGLGHFYERGGMLREARLAYARASGLEPSASPLDGECEETRADALRAYALLARRQRRYDDAARAWQGIVEMRGVSASIVRDAHDALAIHHEHRLRDPRRAKAFALSSLELRGSASRAEALQHRLARLNRKIGTASTPLFARSSDAVST